MRRGTIFSRRHESKMFWKISLNATILLLLLILCPGWTALNAGAPVCSGDAIETDGMRRLALVVGVGDYESPDVKDLAGPAFDAQRFHELLTGSDGYGFPAQNVCLLLDSEATTQRFRQAFQEALINRARQNDVAVIFFAGHGSWRRDDNGDEPDEKDETLLLYDARTEGVPDLPDDEFNGMLADLHKKTRNIVVVLDSCNSGSATRGSNPLQARYQPPAEEVRQPLRALSGGDGSQGWIPEDLPGLVFFAAAADGEAALERDGRGIFTDALIEVLSQVGSRPLTYAQAARQIPSLVSARSSQIPFFHGDLRGDVFGNSRRTRPIAWEVRSAEPPWLELAGPPRVGMGQGAELRIYDGAAKASDLRDPGKAKATAVVSEMQGLNAKAKVVAALAEAPSVKAGDLALLVRPGDDYLKVAVRLRPHSEPGGIPPARAQAVQRAVQDNPEARMLVTVSPDSGEFELALSHDGRFQLLDPGGSILNTFDRAGEERFIARNLWQHARRKAFLSLNGEGGEDFSDNETLQVRAVPAPAQRQTPCSDGEWVQSLPNREQVIPLCHHWNVEVTLSRSASKPLLVGGFVLSSDGAIAAFPADGRSQRLKPGETCLFNQRRETFFGQPPLDVQDYLVVFGTQETNPVAWHLLADTAARRASAPQPSTGLYGALDRYLRPGSRGVRIAAEDVEDTTWTRTSLTIRVEANSRFKEPDPAIQRPSLREYTIPNFDIRPYLPDDPDTALYKVLQEADRLARYSTKSEVPYRQHGWQGDSDEENLALGIDSSRAIWFAFTHLLQFEHQNGPRILVSH